MPKGLWMANNGIAGTIKSFGATEMKYLDGDKPQI